MSRSVLVLAVTAWVQLAAAAVPALVPNPESLVAGEGVFRITASTPIVARAGDRAANEAGAVFRDLLAGTHGLRLGIRGAAAPRAIELRVAKGAARPESYRLEVRPERVLVTASTRFAGLLQPNSCFRCSSSFGYSLPNSAIARAKISCSRERPAACSASR